MTSQVELQTAFPGAHFYFHKGMKGFPGILEDYDAGKCKVMAVGYEDTSMDTSFLNSLCERDLVYTDSLLIEIPMGFPISPELNKGVSYWIHQGI